MENGKLEIASKRGQRELACFAEREQLKDTEGGLKLRVSEGKGSLLTLPSESN